MVRNLKYKEALSEGLCQSMERDESIFVAGIGVDYSAGVFGSTTEAVKRFRSRVFDTPAMENGLTGIAIGAAAMGKRPVIIHARDDFMFLALDQLLNLAAKWKYMYGGNAGSVPVVTRAIIGRGWGQGATHSQSLQSVLAHFPGLAVVIPATPYDAKGLTIAALSANYPTVILEHRSLYEMSGYVPEIYFHTEIGKANVVRKGTDITIVATSILVQEALVAAKALEQFAVDVEVVDARSIRPLDERTILASIHKTGRLIVADTSWGLCGFASEIAALVAEQAFRSLKCAVRRITLPDCPAPVAHSLEEAFYPTPQHIVTVALGMMNKSTVVDMRDFTKKPEFVGPY